MIQLKRARNSLLNISTRVPPEILGYIFRWSVVWNTGHLHLSESQKGSYRFLLVCHHWFEVASHTPGLWNHWGKTLEQWFRQSKRSGTSLVDLVLSGRQLDHSPTRPVLLNGALQDALRDRAERNAIRSVHLHTERRSLQTTILSALTPGGENIRDTSIESVSLGHVDVSKFFARHRFPKLWYLNLSTGVQISSWEDLGSNITALTTLSIKFNDETRIPTMARLLSILASNPRLQDLTLSRLIFPHDEGGVPSVTISLRLLKKLSIDGNFYPVSKLLQQLDYTERMVEMTLTVSHDMVGDDSWVLGPYLRNHIQRDGRFRDGLGIFVDSQARSVSIRASAINDVEGPDEQITFATFTVNRVGDFTFRSEVQLYNNFPAYIPVEHVVYFGGDLAMPFVERAVSTMPNIQELHLINATLADKFLQPDLKDPLVRKKLLPSLQRLYLEDLIVEEDEHWRTLLPYLAHQTSGGQRISLTVESALDRHICKDVVAGMKFYVRELSLDVSLDDDCPFGYCRTSSEEEEDDEW